MSGNFLRTKIGLSVDDLAFVMYTDVIPGTSGLTSTVAPGAMAIGSSGSSVQGKIYQKILSGTGTDKWQQLINSTELSTAIAAASAAFDGKESVRVATTANLLVTAAGAGVTKTLTSTVNGAISVDGVTLSLGDRVLVKDQTLGQNNGIYSVTTVGTVGTPYVLTRTDDANVDSKVTPGLFAFVEEGTANADKGYLLITNGPISLDTTPLSFTVFASAGGISALQAELDATQASLGTAINANGTYAGFTGTNHINGSSSITNAITLLDAEIGSDPVANTRTNNPIVAGVNLNDNIEKLDDAIGSDSQISPNVRGVGQLSLSNSVYSNLDQLDNAIGTGAELSPTSRTVGVLSSTNSILANLEQIDNAIGSDVTPQVRTANPISASNSLNANIDALDTAVGGNLTSTNYAVNTNSINANISLLDSQVKANSDSIANLRTKTVTAIAGGSFVTVASVDVNTAQHAYWKVLIKETATPAKLESIFITGLHNKSGAGDATLVDSTDSHELLFNSFKINGFDYQVVLSGTGAGQKMDLQLKATNASTATVYTEVLSF